MISNLGRKRTKFAKNKAKFIKGFTMVELILVIVIIGILSVFAMNIFLNIYRNYVISKSVNYLESKTELVLEQVTAILSDRIHDTTIGRKGDSNNSSDIIFIDSVTDQHTILEWIGRSAQSQNLAGDSPKDSVGWSGFVDLEDSNSSLIKTPGSNLSEAKKAIENITNNSDTLGLVFAGVVPLGVRQGNGYGLDGKDAEYVMSVKIDDDDTIISNTEYNKKISQYYQLAHTAYAIVPSQKGKLNRDEFVEYDYDGDGVGDFVEFELYLYYDYQPWNGGKFSDTVTKKTLLAENVTLFRFRGNAGGIDIKLCMRDPDFVEVDYIVCKSKVVF
ncbi:MAG: prepilin-type N-terminal cleavage/methylation domain-containing protein [Campylobacter sp.]|nr:prepilin-type N-terminal cleavage/methylation domain-containing protein [Campylobacter sp.]